MYSLIRKWREEGLDLKELLKKREGFFVEIGGPTFTGYDIVDIDDLERKVYISNLFPGNPKVRGGKIIILGKVDFVADGRNFPFKNGVLGAVFVSSVASFKDPYSIFEKYYERFLEKYYDKQLPEKIIQESFRALEPGGLLVWQSCQKHCAKFAWKMGFRILKYSGLSNIPYYYCVFEKPTK